MFASTLGAKEGYYGNCLGGQLVMAMSATMADGDIMDAKERIPRQLKEKGGGSHNQPQAAAEGPRGRHGDMMLRYNYNIVSVSSMRNIGLDEADFGRPARVMCRSWLPHAAHYCAVQRGLSAVERE
jgi:hypothetical protein